MATFTGGIGTGGKWLLDRIVGLIAATGINPNFLTFLGLLVNFAAAASFAVGNFRTGALIIFFAGFLDMLDGQVARRQKRVTAFGAFYDSTLDRYADMALYMGLLVYYSVSGRTPYVILAAVATAGSVMVSYARARAESLIPLCKVGFMERPERLGAAYFAGAEPEELLYDEIEALWAAIAERDDWAPFEAKLARIEVARQGWALETSRAPGQG